MSLRNRRPMIAGARWREDCDTWQPCMACGHRSKADTPRFMITQYIENLLRSDHRDPPIEVVIELGVVPAFVGYLEKDDFPELQYQAALVLQDIASGDPQVVFDHGAVPKFVKLLSAPNDVLGVCVPATWALGSIAGASTVNRDSVLADGALSPLLSLINGQPSKVSFLQAAAFTLSSFCSGMPQPHFDLVKPALPALVFMVGLKDETVLIYACWAICSLSDGNNDQIQTVCDNGVCPRLVRLLLHRSSDVRRPVLSTFGNILKGNDNHFQMLIDSGALPCLHTILTKEIVESSIKDEVYKHIFKIAEGNEYRFQALVTADLISPLVHLLSSPDFDLNKSAGKAVSRLMVHGSLDQIKTFVDDTDGCMRALCGVLRDPNNNKRFLHAFLTGMEKLMDVGEFERFEGITGRALNSYFVEFANLDGLDIIVKLHTHADAEIRKRADSVMEYFVYAEERKKRGL